MPVTDVSHDLDSCTLVITAEFAAPPERIWQVYADPRQLEQVWGPPGFPATFVEHDLSVGGRSRYFMTSPDGGRSYGWWQVVAVDEPHGFAFDDGFAADEAFTPLDDMPVARNVYAFAAIERGTRATFTITYDSAETLQRVLDTGLVDGMPSAIEQIDGLVAA